MSSFTRGPAIDVNGVKPDWLSDLEMVTVIGGVFEGDWTVSKIYWEHVKRIALHHNNYRYKVLARGFKLLNARVYTQPLDWDGKPVLLRDGTLDPMPCRWGELKRWGPDSQKDIVGYNRNEFAEYIDNKNRAIAINDCIEMLRSHGYKKAADDMTRVMAKDVI